MFAPRGIVYFALESIDNKARKKWAEMFAKGIVNSGNFSWNNADI